MKQTVTKEFKQKRDSRKYFSFTLIMIFFLMTANGFAQEKDTWRGSVNLGMAKTGLLFPLQVGAQDVILGTTREQDLEAF